MNPASFTHNFASDSPPVEFRYSHQPNLLIENDHRQKIAELESINSSLRQDNANLSNRCNERFKEVAMWRSKCSNLEQTLSKVPFITSENERLNDLLIQRTKEIDSLKTRTFEAEKEGSAMNGLKSQVALLISENERVNNLFNEKVKEINALKLIVAQTSEMDFKIQAVAQERDRISAQYAEKVRENESLRARLAELDSVNLIIDELKNRLYLLASENDRINTILVEKTQEVNLLNNKIAESNSSGLNIQAVIKECDKLRNKISTLEQDASGANELKFKVSLLVFETERLNNLLAEKTKEIDNIRHRDLQFSSESTQMSELRIRLAQLEQDNQQLKTVTAEKDRELQGFQLRSYETDRLVLLRIENERLSESLEEKARELESLRLKALEADSLSGQVRNLNDEKIRLNEIVIEKSRENEGLRNKNAAVSNFNFEARVDVSEKEKNMLKLTIEDRERVIVDLRSRISDFENGINELKARIVLIVAENDRLSKALSDKSIEIEALKSKPVQYGYYGENDLRLQIVTAEKDRLSTQVMEKTREVEDLKRRQTESEGANTTINELRGRISFLTFENERLERLLAEKSRESEGFRLQLTYNSGSEYRLQEALKERDTLNLRLSEKIGETEQLRRRIADLEREYRAMEDLKVQLSMLRAENERLKSFPSAKVNTYGSFGFGYQPESSLEMERKCKMLLETNDKLNSVVMEKVKEIDSLKQEVVKLSQQNKNDYVSKEYDVFTSGKQEVSKLSQQNKNYDYLSKGYDMFTSEKKTGFDEGANKYSYFGSPYISVTESPKKYEGYGGYEGTKLSYYETSPQRDNSFLTRLGLF